MSRTTLPPKGMFRPRTHKHGCGHVDDCHLEYYAATTDCRKCRAARFNRHAAQDLAAAGSE